MEPIRVLVAEDAKIIRTMVQVAVRALDSGAEVIEARNGEEALAAFREKPVDVVVCDIAMPLMDGIELIRRLRRDERAEIPIVVISGCFTEQRAAAAIKLRVDGMLCKPFTVQEMVDALRVALAKREEQLSPAVQ